MAKDYGQNITLEVNLAWRGTLEAVRWFENEHGRAVIVTLQAEAVNGYPAGKSFTFLAEELGAAEQLEQLGAASQQGSGDKPKWRVHGRPVLEFTKRKRGKDAATLEVVMANGSGAPAQASSTNGNGHSRTPQGPAGMPPEEARKRWIRIREVMRGAAVIAAEALADGVVRYYEKLNTEAPQPLLDQSALARMTNEVVIVAEREGLIPNTPGKLLTGQLEKQAQEERVRHAVQPAGQPYGAPPADEDEDDLPF